MVQRFKGAKTDAECETEALPTRPAVVMVEKDRAIH